MIVGKIENGLELGFVHRLNCLLITDPKFLVVDNYAVFLFEKGNCFSRRQLTAVDNDILTVFPVFGNR